jgi:hypothetical protein
MSTRHAPESPLADIQASDLVDFVPDIQYERFEDYAFHCASIQMNTDRVICNVIDHNLWSDGLRGVECKHHVHALIIIEIARQCMQNYKKISTNEMWLSHCNMMMLLQLQLCVDTFFTALEIHHLKCTHASLKRVLIDTMNIVLGYPDCCWGWKGPGIMQRILCRNFVIVKSSIDFLVPRFQIPSSLQAFCMGLHDRLGEKSQVKVLVDDVLRIILSMFCRDLHAINFYDRCP